VIEALVQLGAMTLLARVYGNVPIAGVVVQVVHMPNGYTHVQIKFGFH
jgi:hypothetical protein